MCLTGFEPAPSASQAGMLPVTPQAQRKGRESNPQGCSLTRVPGGSRHRSGSPSQQRQQVGRVVPGGLEPPLSPTSKGCLRRSTTGPDSYFILINHYHLSWNVSAGESFGEAPSSGTHKTISGPVETAARHTIARHHCREPRRSARRGSQRSRGRGGGSVGGQGSSVAAGHRFPNGPCSTADRHSSGGTVGAVRVDR